MGPEKMGEVESIVFSMLITLQKHRGFGLAAPQVAISKRIIVWTDEAREKPFVAINPEVVSSRGRIKTIEGCLSLPGIQRAVKRKRVIKVVALDEQARRVTYKLKNIDAVIVQHEIDHLNGITILDGPKKRRRAERAWDENTKSK